MVKKRFVLLEFQIVSLINVKQRENVTIIHILQNYFLKMGKTEKFKNKLTFNRAYTPVLCRKSINKIILGYEMKCSRL